MYISALALAHAFVWDLFFQKPTERNSCSCFFNSHKMPLPGPSHWHCNSFIFSTFHIPLHCTRMCVCLWISRVLIIKQYRNVSHSVVSNSLRPHELPTRLLCPWNSPGKNTEWAAIPFSGASPWPKDWTQISWIAGTFFTILGTREAHLQPWIIHTFPIYFLSTPSENIPQGKHCYIL